MRSILLVAALTLYASNAIACGCNNPTTLEELNGNWAFAFIGKVEEVERSEEGGIITEIVTFDVIQNLTDVKDKKARVLFRKGWNSCDLIEPSFKQGETYTLTLTGRIDVNLYYNNFCNLRLKH